MKSCGFPGLKIETWGAQVHGHDYDYQVTVLERVSPGPGSEVGTPLKENSHERC